MLEFTQISQEVLDTRTRVNIDLIRAGVDFLQQFNIKHQLLKETAAIIYRFLRLKNRVPHNLFKYFIAAYYIVERHPKAFPVHVSKKRFCDIFKIPVNSLEYTVDKIINTLGLIKILDDKKYPYYFDPKTDIAFKLAKSIIKSSVEKKRMNFLIYNQPINPQIITEDLINELIFKMKLFPEELFKQFYDIIYDLVEKELKEHFEYIHLQTKYFI
ncbi:MAG: hypothetical protein ACTSQS_13405 [Promethearchaeota archaeon]